MRAWCPHCGSPNDFAAPPTTSIVRCQVCQSPFGSALVRPVDPSTARLPTTDPSRVSRRVAVTDHAAPLSSASTGPAVRVWRNAEGWQEQRTAQVIVPEATLARSEGPIARVIYVSPDGMDTEFPLRSVTRIGRHPANEIRLNDREISKQHAKFEQRDGVWWVFDLKSSNGTFLNSRRVREAQLHDGDELLFGSMRLVFKAPEVTPERDSPRDLVTILPLDDPIGGSHIHAKLDEDEEQDFLPAGQVTDVEVLRRDYEKLRLTHELSRIGLSTSIKELLVKTLDVVFGMLPADTGVIMLVDGETNTLVPHTVRHRDEQDSRTEVLLSSSIVNASLKERASVLSSDALVDPRFSGKDSIIAQGIRSAMCVPMVANDTAVGIMHLDSRRRVGAFAEKDLQLLKAIATQTAIAVDNVRLLRQVEQEAQTRGQLSRFLPPHVVEEMVQGGGRPIKKGGREVQASAVFCDIRGFTSLSEASGPQEVVDLLNDYFERLVEVVFRWDGVLDKFIGDALMASWGTLEGDETKSSAVKAVKAAIEFRDVIRMLNEERKDQGQVPIQMGVGVNTGHMVAGYMGARRRLEFTVIGDSVNTASRICGIAEGDQVLISEATHSFVADEIEARYLGIRRVKGREQDVGVFEATRVRTS